MGIRFNHVMNSAKTGPRRLQILVPMHPIFVLVLLLYGGECSLSVNEACNPPSSRLDPATHKFISDCDSKTFCDSSTKTCQLKQCRSGDPDASYGPGDLVPSLCPHDTYCPDAQNECRPLVTIGNPCELNRDGMRHLWTCISVQDGEQKFL